MTIKTDGTYTYDVYWFAVPRDVTAFTFDADICAQGHFLMSTEMRRLVNEGAYETVLGADQSQDVVRIRKYQDGGWSVRHTCLLSIYIVQNTGILVVT